MSSSEIRPAPVASGGQHSSGEATPHQLSRSADCRTEFAAARLGVKTDDLIAAVESFNLSIGDATTVQSSGLVQRLWEYGNDYNAGDAASERRARDMQDAAGLLNHYWTTPVRSEAPVAETAGEALWFEKGFTSPNVPAQDDDKLRERGK